MELGLGRISRGAETTGAMSVESNPLMATAGIEFHEVGVVTVLGGTDADGSIMGLVQ
jgi:hypothetical protein